MITVPLELAPYPNLHVAEWSVILVAAVVFVASSIVMIYILKNRHYKPLKAKQLDLVTISFVAGWLYIIGSLQARWVFRHEGFFGDCKFWGIVVQLMFGGYLWITSLFFRLYKLYFILIKPDMRKQAQNPNWMYFRLAIIYSPCFLICVIGLATNGILDEPVLMADGSYIAYCHVNKVWTKAFLSLAATYFLLMLFLAYLLRDIRLSFNEFSGTKHAGLIGLQALGLYGLILFLDYDYEVWGRVVVNYLLIIVVTGFFIVSVWNPLWGCYFDKENYALQFRLNMSKDATRSSKGKAKSTGGNSSQSRSHTEDDSRGSFSEQKSESVSARVSFSDTKPISKPIVTKSKSAEGTIDEVVVDVEIA